MFSDPGDLLCNREDVLYLKLSSRSEACGELKTKGIFFKCSFKSLCRVFGTIEIIVVKKEYGMGMILSIDFKAEM